MSSVSANSEAWTPSQAPNIFCQLEYSGLLILDNSSSKTSGLQNLWSASGSFWSSLPGAPGEIPSPDAVQSILSGYVWTGPETTARSWFVFDLLKGLLLLKCHIWSDSSSRSLNRGGAHKLVIAWNVFSRTLQGLKIPCVSFCLAGGDISWWRHICYFVYHFSSHGHCGRAFLWIFREPVTFWITVDNFPYLQFSQVLNTFICSGSLPWRVHKIFIKWISCPHTWEKPSPEAASWSFFTSPLSRNLGRLLQDHVKKIRGKWLQAKRSHF